MLIKTLRLTKQAFKKSIKESSAEKNQIFKSEPVLDKKELTEILEGSEEHTPNISCEEALSKESI